MSLAIDLKLEPQVVVNVGLPRSKLERLATAADNTVISNRSHFATALTYRFERPSGTDRIVLHQRGSKRTGFHNTRARHSYDAENAVGINARGELVAIDQSEVGNAIAI